MKLTQSKPLPNHLRKLLVVRLKEYETVIDDNSERNVVGLLTYCRDLNYDIDA